MPLRKPQYRKPASDNAADVAREIHGMVHRLLRNRYPFMKADALNAMAKGLANKARAEIEKQETAMSKTRSTFSFFSIPAELREQIYQYVLVKPRHPTDRNAYEVKIEDNWPALLQVCKTIRHEATPIYLGQNDFISDCNEKRAPLRRWLKMLGPERADMLKKVIIDLWEFDRTDIKEEINRRPKMNLAVNKKNIVKAFRLQDYGVSHEAFLVQYDNGVTTTGGKMRKLLDNGSSVLIPGY